MAKTAIGYFSKRTDAEKFVNQLLEQGYDPEAINLIFKEVKQVVAARRGQAVQAEEPAYDSTLETGGPVAEYKEALFGSDITEEDAIYYQSEVEKGTTLVAVYIPTDPQRGRGWENETADKINSQMRARGSYDQEARQIYSNRGMTTYPQTRWMDPAGMISARDRIYLSASPLNAERSTVVGQENVASQDVSLEKGGRRVESAAAHVSEFARAEAEALEKARKAQG